LLLLAVVAACGLSGQEVEQETSDLTLESTARQQDALGTTPRSEVAMPEGISPPVDLQGDWTGVFVELDRVDEEGIIIQPGCTTLFPGLNSYANNQSEPGYQLVVGGDGAVVEVSGEGPSACNRHLALQDWDGKTGTLGIGPAQGDCPDQFGSMALSVVPEGLMVTAHFDTTVGADEPGSDVGAPTLQRWRRSVYFSDPQRLVLEAATTSFFLKNETSAVVQLSECVTWAQVTYGQNDKTSGCVSAAPVYDSCESMRDDFEARGHDDCHEQVELPPGQTRKAFWTGAWREEVMGHGHCVRWGPPAPAGEYFVTVSYLLGGQCFKQTSSFLYPVMESLDFAVEE